MKSLLTLLLCSLLTLTACAPQPAANDAPPTPLPEPSAAPTIAPTPTPDPADCLNGDWVLNTEQAQQLLAYLTSQPSLTIIEGTLRLRFEEGGFAYHSDGLILRTSFLDGFIQANANILIEGTRAIEGDKLLFTQTSADNKLTDWKALDAQGTALPLVFANTPVMAFTIADQAAYTCAADALMLNFEEDALKAFAFEFERVK